ncbi:Gp49-like PF05973 family protein [Olsenella uli MSTE5]|nr:Gp49-like PF05973 family protein [Olsenella uli MSTE5]
MWQVDFTLVADWIATLDDETVAAIVAATDVLERQGPALGRPLVDAITGSRLKNMKELRPASPVDSEIRILFAFDSVRMGTARGWRQSERQGQEGEMVGLVQKGRTRGREALRRAPEGTGRWQAC